MKRYIINILIFFGLIALIDFGVGSVGDYLQAHAKGGETREFNDLVRNDIHDVLILGSSRAHHHYDTPFLSDTLGVDIYNAGIDGNGVVLSYGILELVLKRYKPQLVIFDVEPAFDIYEYKPDNNHIRYLSKLKPYFKEAGIDNIIKDVSADEWRKVQSGLVRYNTTIIPILVDNVVYKGRFDKGFEPFYGVMQRELTEADNVKMNRRDQFKIDYLEKLILLCKNENVPLVMVASPKFGASNSTAFEPVVTLCAKYQVPFWDFYANEEFMNHKEWFKEPMHLNYEGARCFSKTLIQRIAPYVQCRQLL